MNKLKENYRHLILLGFPITLFLFIRIYLDFNGLYGQDSHAYYQYALELKSFFEQGSSLSPFNWPKLFPFIGALIGLTGFPILLGLQLTSLLALVGVLFYGNKCIYLLHQKDGSWFLLLGAASTVYFSRGGLLLMSDMLSAFFIVLAYYHYLSVTLSKKHINTIYVFVFSILAVYTRYPAALLLALPIIKVLQLSLLKFPKYLRLILITLVFVLATALLVFNNNMLHLSTQLFSQWSFKNLFTRTFISSDGAVHQWVPNVLYILGSFFHIGLLAFGILLLPFYRKIKTPNKIILVSVALYLLFVGGLLTQNYRFFIISHALVLFLLFPAFSGLWQWLKQKKIHSLFVIGVLSFNIAFYTYSFSKTYQVYRVEKLVVKKLNELNITTPIYSFYVDQSFKSYGIKNEVRNLYYKEFTDFETGALVVFNEHKFASQWVNTPVMNNWQQINELYDLDTLATLTDDWQIYLIK